MKDFRVNFRPHAKPDMFVWIPSGFINGKPDGMTGYWDGTLREDSGGTERAEVEFIVDDGFAKVLVNKYQIYAATDDDIEKELVENETQSWRDFQISKPE